MGKRDSRKQPKITQEIGDTVVPKLSQFKRDGQVYFSFCKFDETNKWGANETSETLNVWDFGTKIKSFESMTWKVLRSNRTFSFYPYADLPTECQNALRKIKMDTFDNLWSLHIDGRRRLWGVRVDGFFLALWYDPDHNVYQTEKN